MTVTSDQCEAGIPIRELMSAIWPTASPIEIADEASLSQLQRLIDSGALQPEHERLLMDYLQHLPGYGPPENREVALRHHGYVIQWLKSRRADLSQSSGPSCTPTGIYPWRMFWRTVFKQ